MSTSSSETHISGVGGRGPVIVRSSEPGHPPDVHLAEVLVGDCFRDQAPRLPFDGERQGGRRVDAHHDPLEPRRDVSDRPLDYHSKT